MDPSGNAAKQATPAGIATSIIFKPSKVGEIEKDLKNDVEFQKFLSGGDTGDPNKGNKKNKKDKDKKQTIKSNKGNKYDNTPSNNHSTTTENPIKGEPNSSVDILDKNGNIIRRRWFGPDGNQIRDLDYTNHGNPKMHPEWPHEHGPRIR